MQLVNAQVGLTNLYPEQVIRNPAVNMDNQVIDTLVAENLQGGVNERSLLTAAALSGGLNAQASGFATIQNGWNDSKGLMKLDFIVQDSPVSMVYMHVIGYIHNNNSQGLDLNAIFVPQFSWKSEERLVGSGLMDIPTATKRTIGQRTDYLMNDGSSTDQMVTMRPGDVVEYALNNATQQSIIDQMEAEGLEGMQPVGTVAASNIARVGVIASKRGNLNPAGYAADILGAGLSVQRGQRIYQGGTDTDGVIQSHGEGLFGELAQSAHQTSGTEPAIMRDNFFAEMSSMLGNVRMAGFTGYSINDLLMVFENLNEVLDLTLYDAEQYRVDDLTLNCESMGTSQLAEFVSHEIMMNVMDLLIKYGLTTISFRGSNCDNFGGDGGLSNIVILPYNVTSLTDNDFDMGSKAEAFVLALTNQIFTKLNGININQLTPIRFDVHAELFGTTTINMCVVTEDNISTGFSMNDAGSVSGMQSRTFPTFAINNASSILGNDSTAIAAGANFYTNINEYFTGY